MNTADTPAPQRGNAGNVSWIGSLFALKLDQFHLGLGVIIVVIMFVPLLALEAVNHTNLWLSFSFGLLFTGTCDIVGRGAFPIRLRRAVAFILIGALLTVLGVLLGGVNWALVVALVFVTTFLSYLALMYGPSGFMAGNLLNIWFLITLGTSLAKRESPAQMWPLVGPQTLAWVIGGALWLAVLCLVWLLSGSRRGQPTPDASTAPVASAPGFSRSIVQFAGLAAVAVALATAVAWGFALPNAVWMPVTAIVALKPDAHASVYASGQRVAGALIGSIVSAVVLTGIHNVIVLGLIISVLGAVGVALHEVNYALYYACISAMVLTGLGLSHPGTLADNWERVAWVLVGVGIALVVMLFASVVVLRTPAQASSAQGTTGAQPPGNAAPT